MNNHNGAVAESRIVSGKRISCLRFGSGSPVLLTHGIPGDFRSLAPVAARLSAKWEPITVSLPTSPAGTETERPFGTARLTDDLIDVIGSLGTGPVHLVSWSYSAHAALTLAVQQPRLVASLFLYELGFPTFVCDEALLAAIRADTREAFALVEAHVTRGDLLGAVRAAIDAAAGEPGYFDNQPAFFREIHEGNARALIALFDQTPPANLSPSDLTSITCPVTIARGAKTRLCYRLVTDAAAGLMGEARFIIVRLANHMLPEHDPDRFAVLVEDHLAQAIRRKAEI